MTDRIPRSTEAEKAFLGACLIDPVIVPQARVLPEDFYDVGRRDTWKVILGLVQDGRVVDVITVHSELEKIKSPARPSEIADLVRTTPSSYHWKEYESEIIDSSYRRKILRHSSELAKLAYDPEPIQGAVAGVIAKITEETPRKGAGLVRFGDTMTGVVEQVIERSKDPREVFGIPTGFIDYDLITGGWQKGQLSIIAGEPGIGKTRFVTQAATYATSHLGGYVGAFFTAEMQNRELALRTISVEGGINLRNLETGKVTDEDWASFYNAISSLSSHALFVDETVNPSPDYIDSELARLRSEGVSFDFVVIDYIFLVAQALMAQDRRMDEIAASQTVTARLKGTAKTFDTAVIAISSITKAGMDSGSPKMGNLRGSGQQLHDGDVVMYISGDETRPDIVTCRFVKGRHLKQRRLQFELVNDQTTPRLLNATVKNIRLDDLYPMKQEA